MASVYGADEYKMDVFAQVQSHTFPVQLDVTLVGLGADTDADIKLKRGTILARKWDAVDDEYKYSAITNWNDLAAEEDTGGTAAIGDLANFFIDPTRVSLLDGSAGDVADGASVDYLTGHFSGVWDAGQTASANVFADYYYGDQDGGSDPVAILARTVDIDSTDDVEGIPVYVMGGFNEQELIFPSDADDDDKLAFVAVMLEKGLIAK